MVTMLDCAAMLRRLQKKFDGRLLRGWEGGEKKKKTEKECN